MSTLIETPKLYYISGNSRTLITPAGNISISYGISGVGSSGVSTRSLHFDATREWLTLPERCPIVLGYSNGDLYDGVTYYTNTRSGNMFTASFDCVDGCALLDQPIDMSTAKYNGQVVPSGDEHKTYKMDNSHIAASDISATIEALSGLQLTSFSAPEPYGFKRITLEGMTYLELLTNLSEIHCGFYAVSGGYLNFVPLKETGTPSGALIGDDHSYVNITGQYTLAHVLIQGKEDKLRTPPTSYTLYPYTTFDFPSYNTLEVNNCFAEFTDTAEFPIGDTFTGWRCDNVLDYLPTLGSWVQFPELDDPLRVLDVSARLVGGHWIVSMGGGLPSGSEIQRRSRRQMETEKKVTAGITRLKKVVTVNGQEYWVTEEVEEQNE